MSDLPLCCWRPTRWCRSHWGCCWSCYSGSLGLSRGRCYMQSLKHTQTQIKSNTSCLKLNLLNSGQLCVPHLPCRGSVSWRWWWGCPDAAAADCSSARSPSASAWSAASGWAPRLSGGRERWTKDYDSFIHSSSECSPAVYGRVHKQRKKHTLQFHLLTHDTPSWIINRSEKQRKLLFVVDACFSNCKPRNSSEL